MVRNSRSDSGASMKSDRQCLDKPHNVRNPSPETHVTRMVDLVEVDLIEPQENVPQQITSRNFWTPRLMNLLAHSSSNRSFHDDL